MNNSKSKYNLPLAFLTMLFFMWGFITCLNDILIPYFKHIFVLTHFQSMLIQFAFFGAYFVGSIIYFVISIISGDPINRIGYKNGILFGLLMASVGTFMFYPAANYQSFGFFLIALFVLALGFTVLQIAANPYVILLGDPNTGSQRLSLAGAINSFGTTIAPIIGGLFILNSANSYNIDDVKQPYLILTALFLLLVVVFKVIQLPKFTNNETVEKGVGALKYPQLTLGIGAIFFYVGAEVSVGSFMSGFVGLENIKGLSAAESTIYISLYWGSLMIGRFTDSVSVFNFSDKTKTALRAVVPVLTFLFILLMFRMRQQQGEVIDYENIVTYYLPFILLSVLAFYIGKNKPGRTLLLFSLICIVLLLISITGSGEIALWSLISVGLYNSIMWPAIFALAITKIGKYTSQGSSLLVMAILGGALIPPFQGYLADLKGIQISFIVPVFCYFYLAYYGWKAPKILANI